MKCEKCNSEMICDRTTMGMPPQFIHECKECGHIAYSKLVEFATSRITPTELSFTCQICGDSQSFYGNERIVFPICDKCKSDLKEYVLSVRKK